MKKPLESESADGDHEGQLLESDVFYTLGKPGRFELKIKGSRFIGHATSAGTQDIAAILVNSISRQYHDATHHCYAYRIGQGDGSIFRMNDDGEPAGTAGKPILDVIDRRRLKNVICVVTRYFGGTKLGTGGLARAYGECAAGTLDNGEVIEKYLTESFLIHFAYEWTGKVMPLMKKYALQMEKGDFKTQMEIKVIVRRSKAETFKSDLMNATSGKVRFT